MNVQHIAIVGLGSIGRRHLRLLHEMRPELEITLVRSGKGQPCPEVNLAQREVYSLAEAIETGVQAAVISSPSTYHVSQSIELIRAGVHLLIEKPLSHNLVNVAELQKLAKQKKVVVLVGYVFRHDPAANHFKYLLRKGVTGQHLHANIESGSYLPDWRPGQDYRKSASAINTLGGGVLCELSHELDYAQWFFGSIDSVQALIQNSGTLEVDVEDTAQLLLVSNNNVPIFIHLDFNRRHPARSCVVRGTAGEINWDVITKGVRWSTAINGETTKLFNYDRDEIYQTQLQHYLSCIEQGIQPAVTLTDGVQTLKIIEAARKSHLTGKRIYL
jgi:predicted dehydrogenase